MDKKGFLKNHISFLAEAKKINRRDGPLWTIKQEDEKSPVYHYHIYSPNLWWSEHIRNSIFRLFFLVDQFEHQKFYLTLDAVRLVLDTIVKFLDREIQGNSQVSFADERGGKKAKGKGENSEGGDMAVHDKTEIEITNAQCNLEAPGAANSSSGGSVLIAAERCRVHQVRYSDMSDRHGTIAKRTSEASIDGTQIFVCCFEDMGLGKMKTTTSPSLQVAEEPEWPQFVPIDFLLNYSSKSGPFIRISDRLKFHFTIDYVNPLYAGDPYPVLKTESSDQGDATSSSVVINCFKLDSPIIHLQCNSSQYCVIFDVVTKLLVYREPAAKKELEDIKAIFLASDFYQTEKTFVLLTRLQDRIRSLNNSAKEDIALINSSKFQLASLIGGRSVEGPEADSVSKALESWSKKMEAMRNAQNDIHIIMEALKLVSASREKKNIGKKLLVRNKIEVLLEKIIWTVKQPPTAVLGELQITRSSFNWVNYDDDSGRLLMSVSNILVSNKNIPKGDKFHDVIGPYKSETSDSSEANQPLDIIRVEFLEAPPVGGIAIYDLLDIRMQPIRLQISRDFAGKLISFFYPEKPSANPNANQGASNNAKMIPSHSVHSLKSIADSGAEATSSSSSKAVGKKALTLSKAKEALMYHKSVAGEKAGIGSSVSLNSLSTVAAGGVSRVDSADVVGGTDIDKMRNRASENHSFALVRIAGGRHCISYKGRREKNIEDIDDFVLRMPNLEYRNKTCSWLDLLTYIKKGK